MLQNVAFLSDLGRYAGSLHRRPFVPRGAAAARRGLSSSGIFDVHLRGLSESRDRRPSFPRGFLGVSCRLRSATSYVSTPSWLSPPSPMLSAAACARRSRPDFQRTPSDPVIFFAAI